MQHEQVSGIYSELQHKICTQLEQAEGKGKFRTDEWKEEIGKGVTMVLSDGAALEKAAVNFSAVSGKISENMRQSLRIKDGERFFGTGISSIIHPKNPYVPIIHMNVRYFELDTGFAWFGGGIDLTPHYINIEEAIWFHEKIEQVCKQFDPNCYPEFKKWADDYFYLPHRQETRGIGGIFFDHKDASTERNFIKLFRFTQSLADVYPSIYIELLNKNRYRSFSEDEKQWQLLRRGRYVEFNLLYDRGTRFGLDSGGRTESIFLSMPPLASWEYQKQVERGSMEWDTIQYLKKGIDWLNFRKSDSLIDRRVLNS